MPRSMVQVHPGHQSPVTPASLTEYCRRGRAGLQQRETEDELFLAAAGNILAILWADPLLSPPAKNHNNKILWVSRVSTVPGSDLRITAQRMIGTTAVGTPAYRSVMGGPGPSIINLPASGCWQFQLRWSSARRSPRPAVRREPVVRPDARPTSRLTPPRASSRSFSGDVVMDAEMLTGEFSPHVPEGFLNRSTRPTRLSPWNDHNEVRKMNDVKRIRVELRDEASIVPLPRRMLGRSWLSERRRSVGAEGGWRSVAGSGQLCAGPTADIAEPVLAGQSECRISRPRHPQVVRGVQLLRRLPGQGCRLPPRRPREGPRSGSGFGRL